MIRTEQPATESAIPAAAFQDPTNQTEAEQILQCAVSEQEQVALLAYSYWQARGCQGGSPEDDWYRAEREVRNGGKQASDVQ